MQVKNIKYEDFVQYKKCSMFIGAYSCSFKCDQLNGCQVCQNMPLATAPTINIDTNKVIQNYLQNSLTEAVVWGGLEPFDQFDEIMEFVELFRSYTNDDIVIYTGYTEEQCAAKIQKLQEYKNIIVKFGPFLLDQEPHYDEVLGVNLANKEQYAKRIS